MTVLSGTTIRRKCRGWGILITGYDEEQFNTGSYDLRLGAEYYLGQTPLTGGAITTLMLDEQAQLLEVPPTQVVLFTTMERLNMPTDLVAHLSLKMDLLLRGLMMANQSQIDAGYRGPIFGLLYNLSDRPVTLRLGDPVFRIEFATLDRRVKPYDGDFGPEDTLASVLSHPVTSSLHKIEQRFKSSVEDVRREGITLARRLQWGLLGAVVGVLAVIFTYFNPFQNAAMDAKTTSDTTQNIVESLRAQATIDRVEMERLTEQVETLQRQLDAQRPAGADTVEP